jgi:hypothetical protein
MVKYGAIITVNKGFLNTNTAITWQQMQMARMLEAEWRQVLRGRVSVGTKEDESSAGHVWAAGFHHVTARSHLAHVLKLLNHLFLYFSNFFRSGGKPWIIETTHTASADMEA